jgi:hypothetical protein
LNFEYEFNYTTEHPDIKIEPWKGIIPGKGSVNIDVTYTPNTNATAVAEAEVLGNKGILVNRCFSS